MTLLGGNSPVVHYVITDSIKSCSVGLFHRFAYVISVSSMAFFMAQALLSHEIYTDTMEGMMNADMVSFFVCGVRQTAMTENWLAIQLS